MDLPHIGSEQLVYIQTDKVSLTIKGVVPADERNPAIGRHADQASFKLFCNDCCEAIFYGNLTKYRLENGKQNYFEVHNGVPLFFEQRNYEIVIEAMVNEKISFWHDNYNIRNKVTSVGRNNRILSGIINFGNEIGLSDFVIRFNDEEYLRLGIEVFPSKIDYQEDYQSIVSDVTKEVYNLVFDFLKRTYLNYQQGSRSQSTPAEFFAVIQMLYKDFLKAADMILVKPHHMLEKNYAVIPVYKIKRLDSRGMRWLEKHPENVREDVREDGCEIFIRNGLAVKKQVTYDTKENRIAKYMLQQTIKKLIGLRKNYQRLRRQTEYAFVNQIDRMIHELNRRCMNPVLREIDAKADSTGMSLVFSKASGYRDLYKYYLMLQRGLSVQGDVFHISVKDLALLYEYWCFIKLNSLLKDRYTLVSQDIIKTQGNGIYISLVKGSGSRVRYCNPVNGESITLSYNPKAIALPTVTQRPDNVLSLKKKGSEMQYEYIFDAKYRINMASPGTAYFLSVDHHPGPEIDDINTMHRYRDAIVYQNGGNFFERTMFGAYVLFPYGNEEEYCKHRFYKSINEVNIGGLPFLPSATNLVTEMLDDLVSDSPESAFERATLPRGIEKKLKKINWSVRDVLLGALSKTEQLNSCLQHRFYHIPASQLDEKKFPIHYVALYQSKRLFGTNAGIRYYGEVTKCIPVKRSVISELPRNSDELYYRLEVKTWKELARPILPKETGFGARMFTNLFLLLHSSEVPELLIHSESEYRLYSELKRMLNHSCINEEESRLGFKINGGILEIEDRFIKVYKNQKLCGQYSVEDFSKYPRAVLKQIQQGNASL